MYALHSFMKIFEPVSLKVVVPKFHAQPCLAPGLRAFYKAGSLVEEWDNLVRQVRARQDSPAASCGQKRLLARRDRLPSRLEALSALTPTAPSKEPDI